MVGDEYIAQIKEEILGEKESQKLLSKQKIKENNRIKLLKDIASVSIFAIIMGIILIILVGINGGYI